LVLTAGLQRPSVAGPSWAVSVGREQSVVPSFSLNGFET